ncbi:MAG: M56 family metallopeptidase [Bryobacteraceae bacterium]
MNAIQMLSSEAWVERLGWTLVHFLWQGLAIALVYGAADKVMARRCSPNGRYLLACAALVAMMAAPLTTWELMRPPAATPGAAYRIRGIPPAPSTSSTVGAATLPDSVRARVPEVRPAQFLAWVVVVWLIGAAALWVRLAGGWVVAARMRSMLVRRASQEWQQTLRKLAAQIGLSRPVRLLVSALVQVPTVVGWLRPVVLVPVGALGGLPDEYVEVLLLHELAHIRRHDYLVNMFQSVAEALLFYHPAVWWVSGQIRAGRELCCDDIAVSVAGDALTYARALAHLESYHPAHISAAALAATGGSLADRIARLLGHSRPAVHTGMGPGVVTIAILLVTAGYGLFAQSDLHPAFEVASIKRGASAAGPVDPVSVSYKPGGRMIAMNAPLRLLIQFAYAVHDSPHSQPLRAAQVMGGPAWIDSEGYNIEAKPEANTDQKHAWFMLQTLLADRFRLTLHRETRDLPVYDLTARNSGIKLPASKEANCVSFQPGMTPRSIPGSVDCGYAPLLLSPTGLRLNGRKLHMADLVRELALTLGRPVMDKTGFTGEFDLNLNYTDDALAKSPDDPGGNRPPAEPNRSIVFAAMQQLGLKLEPAKGPVEVLVVDHAERPTAN